MVLLGAGGHGKVVKSACQHVVAFFDGKAKISNFEGLEVHPYDTDLYKKEKLVITIGNNETRKRLSETVKHAFGLVVAPSAEVDSSVSVGEGSQLLHKSVVQVGTRIGKHVIINTNANVDHDCEIEDFVHIAPGVTLCGTISVGEGTLIGAGSVVLPNIKIGKWCTIGAGSVVTRNIPDNTRVKGNPAK